GYHRGGHASLQDGNKLRALTLKRGYMATLAVAKQTAKVVGETNDYDTGKVPFWGILHSKVFVAVEQDLSLELDDDLAGKVNFISVQPWRWVSKKGNCTHNQQVSEMQGDWSYNWGLGAEIERQPEYSPMMFGKGRIARNDLWEVFTDMGDGYRGSLTHLMGFNEPDHKAQSNMTVADAIAGWPRFLETGARLVSPSVTQGGHKHWLASFYQECNDSAYRVDAMGIHWYDWGGWRKDQDPNADPVAIFERFKVYLAARHREYQRPLWITEFNANKNRNHWVHEEFLKRALPYLDSLPYVERYAFFEPFGGLADFFDPDGRLTPVGKVYRNHQSVPSIKDLYTLEGTEMDIK
ncbi:MAG: glycosyl hydrolase, partial [Bacteroidia bacterium]